MACNEPQLEWTRSIWNNRRLVKDPVQGGMLKNCSLIAGIASLAWKQKNRYPAWSEHTLSNFIVKRILSPIQILQQTDWDNRPIRCRQNLMNPTEFWPSLYEKAYYQWLDKLGLTKPSERPKYCLHTAWQIPATVLFQLTGKTVTTKSCTDWNTVFNDINGFCTNCARSIINRSINSPAVAWTYDPTISNPNNAAYSDATIAARHTYSLLGVVNLGDHIG